VLKSGGVERSRTGRGSNAFCGLFSCQGQEHFRDQNKFRNWNSPETPGGQRFMGQVANHGLGSATIPQSAEFCTWAAGHGSWELRRIRNRLYIQLH
jgi:hypothetical protein